MSRPTLDQPLGTIEIKLLKALQSGLPLVSRPYQHLADQCGTTEDVVLSLIGSWTASGLIKRLGVIVRHQELGYRANAMVVFDVPDPEVGRIADQILRHAFVTLCYQRPRRGPDWPYNLFCMIHGRDRATVEHQIEELRQSAGLIGRASSTLFSTHCYKQRGARYALGAHQRNKDHEHG